jgi:hypothetical protein
MDTAAPWNAPHADAQTVDSWGGGTAVSAFPPLVAVTSHGSGANGNGLETVFQCPSHPLFRTPDAAAFCPHCEQAWTSQRAELQSKRASVEEQLHHLSSTGNANDSAAAILQDLQVSMKEWKPQPEEEAAPAATSYGGQPPRAPTPPFEGNPPQQQQQQQQSHMPPFQQQMSQGNMFADMMGAPPPPMSSPPMNGSGMPSSASFFPPFYQQQQQPGNGGPPGNSNNNNPNQNHGGMPAFAMQLHSMQRMQDWMLWQKEQECQQLRASLEDHRTEVQQLRVDKALLQEKLYQQEERMKHELKLIKLAALSQQQQQQQHQQQNNHRSMKKGAVGGSSGKQYAPQSHNNNSQNSGSQNSSGVPVVLLPDHMLNGGSGKYPPAEARQPAQPPVQVTITPSSVPRTLAASTSAFGTPPSPALQQQQPQQQPKATNLSLASYQSAEESPASETSSPAAKTVDPVLSPASSRASRSTTTEVSSSPRAAKAKTVSKTTKPQSSTKTKPQQQPDSITRQVSNDSARSGSSARSRNAASKKQAAAAKRTAKSNTSWITKLGRRKSPPEAAPAPAVPVDVDALEDKSDDKSKDDSQKDTTNTLSGSINVQEEKKETAVEEQEEQRMDPKDVILSKMTSSDEDDSDYKEEEEDEKEDDDGTDDLQDDDVQQHPVVDMTDDDDFDVLVRNAGATEIPADLISAVTSDDAAPIQVLQMTPTPTVPLQEQVTFGTKGTEEMPPPTASPSRGVSFPDDDDNASMGQTVASSTFGEDRHKVADQIILDPYGDKGTYTGIILRSTGMYVLPWDGAVDRRARTYSFIDSLTLYV